MTISHFLASFAVLVSDRTYQQRPALCCRFVFKPSTSTTQGRLHCTQFPLHAGFHPNRRLQVQLTGDPRIWVSTETGVHPHAIVDYPISLTPSIDPQLGVESRHQELHRCAL